MIKSTHLHFPSQDELIQYEVSWRWCPARRQIQNTYPRPQHTWEINLIMNLFFISPLSNLWIISSTPSSLSPLSTAKQKKRLAYLLYTTRRSLYSIKLHILGFLNKMAEVRSLAIFFFSLDSTASYHFCSLSFPCLLNIRMNWIMVWKWGKI